MKIITETTLDRFEFWSGAKDTAEIIDKHNAWDQLEAIFDEMYPDGIEDGRLNDLLWFEDEWIFEVLGIKNPYGEEKEEDELDEVSLEGYWMENPEIPVYSVEPYLNLYALSGWNGEDYTKCWECDSLNEASNNDTNYIIYPITRAESLGLDLSTIEENSPEWEHALEIVDLKFC